MATRQSKTYSPTPLHHLMFILQQSADELLAQEVGVSLSHVRILGALDTNLPCSQRVIASLLYQTEANISRQIRVMADYGLVKIAPNKKDHRQRDVTLTSKGFKKFEQAQKLLKKQESQFLRLLNTGDQKTFTKTIEQLSTSTSVNP